MLSFKIVFVELALLFCALATSSNDDRSFLVDYDNHVYLKNGKPYRYISGDIHYFRIPPSLWQDRLHRVRAAGLNAVQVYVPWNFHEILAGVVDFKSADKNLTQFLLLAQQNELDVLLRIGPYICAEWENGGLPWWLLRHDNISMRTSDARYKAEVKKYFDVLLPIVKPLLHKNGGPVIMVQIENEYGSFQACDKDYLRWLRDEVHGALGADTQLYTTDGSGASYLRCGTVEGVFPTVDFGVTTSSAIQRNFDTQQNFSKGGPYTNSEFYTVWFTGWGGPIYDQGEGEQSENSNDTYSPMDYIQNTLDSMDYMSKVNASFSFYMIHGGTNFGFWSGDETTGPVITSYDYSAPISEAGQITPLYLAIRDFIQKLPNWPNPPLEVPKNHTAIAIDNVKTVRVGSLISVVENSLNKNHCKSSEMPLSFEVLDNQYDLVLYTAVLPTLDGSNSELAIHGLHDYAYVFVDGVYQGHLATHQEYTKSFTRLSLPLKNGTAGSKLQILVESHGRRTFETINDYKGILSNVTVDKQVVTRWLQCGVNPNNLYSQAKKMWSWKSAADADEDGSPAVYVGTFVSDVDWQNYHTFFDARKWNKGFVIVNNFNLGRYWTSMGPQMTLYTPGAVFRKKNVLLVIELVGQKKSSKAHSLEINFLDKPIFKQVKQDKQTQKHHYFRHHHKHN